MRRAHVRAHGAVAGWRRLASVSYVLMVTTNELPGYEIQSVMGTVFGLTVRARDIGANFFASLRAIGGGEITEMTQLLHDSRIEVLRRLALEAQGLQASAVIGLRFDAGEISGQWTEICAYGTAVRVTPVTAAARAQYESMAAAGLVPRLPSTVDD